MAFVHRHEALQRDLVAEARYDDIADLRLRRCRADGDHVAVAMARAHVRYRLCR